MPHEEKYRDDSSSESHMPAKSDMSPGGGIDGSTVEHNSLH